MTRGSRVLRGILVEKDFRALSMSAARIVAQQILERPNSTLALPTGETPKGMYAFLVRFYQEGLLDFSQVTVFNLDEFLAIPPDHPQGFRAYMQEHLWSKVNLNAENIHIPSSTPEDPWEECSRYEALIEEAGGIDLAVLGIGANGHIAFNEPGTPFESLTHVAVLSPDTRKNEASRFGGIDGTPERAITMGIKTIMRARRILLLASGEEKAEILAKAIFGPVTPEIPASVLQLHPSLTVVVDEGAARRLL